MMTQRLRDYRQNSKNGDTITFDDNQQETFNIDESWKIHIDNGNTDATIVDDREKTITNEETNENPTVSNVHKCGRNWVRYVYISPSSHSLLISAAR